MTTRKRRPLWLEMIAAAAGRVLAKQRKTSAAFVEAVRLVTGDEDA